MTEKDRTQNIIRKLGGAVAVATALGIKSQAVSQWHRVPTNRCKGIEELSGGKYSRAKLRPDVFG